MPMSDDRRPLRSVALGWWVPLGFAALLGLVALFVPPAPLRRSLLVSAGILFVGAGLGWAISAWMRRRWRTFDPPAVSLVGLLERPARLEAVVVAARASEAWRVEVGTEEDDNESAYVVGESPHLLLKWDEWLFAIHEGEGRFLPDADLRPGSVIDVRVRRVSEEHVAWISIDLLYAPGDADARDAYRLIAPLMAELVEEDLLGVHRPETGAIVPRTPALVPALRGSDPAAAIGASTSPLVLTIREDDPRMLAAVATARSRWPEFVSAFETRSTDIGYSVKAPVTDGERTEFLWLNVTAIENDVVYGTLGNDPVELRHLRLNDRTSVGVDQLNDWLFVVDGESQGGFTLDVFRRVANEDRDSAET